MLSRKRLRLPGYDYTWPGVYFVTVCVRGRACLLGDVVDDRACLTEAGQAVERCWHRLAEQLPQVTLDAFVVMPNHVHGIVVLDRAGQARPLHLATVVAAFKSCASRSVGGALWQRGYFERVIRNETELAALRRYIADNPIGWAVDRENPAVQRPV